MKLLLIVAFLFNSLIASEAEQLVLWKKLIPNSEYGDITICVVQAPGAFEEYDAMFAGVKVLPAIQKAFTPSIYGAQPRVFDGIYSFTKNNGSVLYTDGLGDCVGIAVYFPGKDEVQGFSCVYHCTRFELFGQGGSGLSTRFEDTFLAELLKITGSADKSQVKIYLASTYLTNSVTEVLRRIKDAGFAITATSFPQIAIDRTQPRGTNVYLVREPIADNSEFEKIRSLTTGIAVNSGTGEILVSRFSYDY